MCIAPLPPESEDPMFIQLYIPVLYVKLEIYIVCLFVECLLQLTKIKYLKIRSTATQTKKSISKLPFLNNLPFTYFPPEFLSSSLFFPYITLLEGGGGAKPKTVLVEIFYLSHPPP